MPTQPKSRLMIECKHCPRTSACTEQVARVLGWRFYTGFTQGGGFLDDVVCPACAGQEEPEPPTWDITCLTCDWSYTDEWDLDEEVDPIPDFNTMESVLRGHTCEPVYQVKAPGTDRWVHQYSEEYAKLRERWTAPRPQPQAKDQQTLDTTPTSP